MDKEDLKLYGRMLECAEIADGISSGKFSTLDDVLNAVKRRSKSMEVRLKNTPNFNSCSLPTKEELELINAIHQSKSSLITKH